MLKKSNRIFINPDKIDSSLFCSICFQVFQDPYTLSCNHIFCYSCIAYERSIRKSCPLCRNNQLIFNPQKNIDLTLQINRLMSKCSHQKCKWTGRYHQLKNHQRSCQFKTKKSQKFIASEIINVLHDDQVFKNVDESKKGRKRIKVDQKEHYEIYFTMKPQQPEMLVLFPPILEPVNVPRPLCRRYFQRENILADRNQFINGSLQNPIVIDNQDNQNVWNHVVYHNSSQTISNNRPQKRQEMNQEGQKVHMTRSRTKMYFQQIQSLLTRFIDSSKDK